MFGDGRWTGLSFIHDVRADDPTKEGKEAEQCCRDPRCVRVV